MRLDSLEINSYKSIIRPLKLKLSPVLNIFIGQNNSGKTNILDAIELVFNSDLSAERFDHYRADISVYLQGQAQPLTIKGNRRSGRPPAPGYLVRLTDERPLQQDFLNRTYQTLRSKYPSAFNRFLELLREAFPQLQASGDILVIQKASGLTFIREGEHDILIDRLGSGFRKVFATLLLAVHPDYPIVLLDEPETHLHPALIKRLYKVLASRATNQIIMTTHSPLFITPQNLHQIYRVARDNKRGTHYFAMNQSAIRVDRQRLVQEFTADNLEVFFADRVLMVEGVSDRILMRGLLDRFYRGPLDIKVIYTHGKGNVDIYMDVLDVFQIPYIVMLDADAFGWWSADFLSRHNISQRRGDRAAAGEALERLRIYILPNGSIEHYYPRKFQADKRKPLNALRAVNGLTMADYQSKQMAYLRQVIEAVTRL